MHNLADKPEMSGLLLEYARKMLTWRLVNSERTMTNMHVGNDGLFQRP
jgi:hypothetical protein